MAQKILSTKMNTKTLTLLGFGIATAGLYILLASSLSETYYIWLLTRIFGLLSFLFLSITLILGELRMLTMLKANFSLFRFHIPSAIFSVYLIVLHGISGMSDNYQWGKGVSFVKYLGFTFTDKWLFALSLGTFAFYLLVVVSLTSMRRMIQFLGFKAWKRIHYLAYPAYILGFVHSIFLGTDVKTSFISPYVLAIFVIIFVFAVSLLLVRMITALFSFEDQLEIKLAAYFVFLLLMSALVNIGYYFHRSSVVAEMEKKVKSLEGGIKTAQARVSSAEKYVNSLKNELEVIAHGAGS